MNDDQKRMRKLTLSYEELTPAERSQVDAYLEGDPILREDLARLRELEALARDPFGLSPTSPSATDVAATLEPDARPLTADEESQEAASRARLLRRADVQFAGDAPARDRSSQTRSRAPRRRRAIVPLAIAAMLAIVVFGPWPRSSELSVLDLRILAIDTDAGLQRGSTAESPLRWSSGDEFALGFSLDHDASIVVYHVDPLGEIAIAYPEVASGEAPRLQSGQALRVPPDSADQTWAFSGRTGQETFIVAASEREHIELQALDALLRTELKAVDDRDARVQRLNSLLSEHVGPTARVDAEHVQ